MRHTVAIVIGIKPKTMITNGFLVRCGPDIDFSFYREPVCKPRSGESERMREDSESQPYGEGSLLFPGPSLFISRMTRLTDRVVLMTNS